ncbi:hypothetical protein D9M71_637180 [compost metagenome]
MCCFAQQLHCLVTSLWPHGASKYNRPANSGFSDIDAQLLRSRTPDVLEDIRDDFHYRFALRSR